MKRVWSVFDLCKNRASRCVGSKKMQRMNIEQRIKLLQRLRGYITSNDPEWMAVKEKAQLENAWFVPEFVEYQLNHIADEYLAPERLHSWVSEYDFSRIAGSPKNVGIVMAGNIPLAGFHDFLSAFVSGHNQTIKPSSKDSVLIKAIVKKLQEWEQELAGTIQFAEQLKARDAYIATGSNNSSRYFEFYFSKYPHIIRKNRTSVAILTGKESPLDLDALADDVYLYFGLGCRNVTKLYVPRGYDFVPLLEAFRRYNWVFDMHKYKNNYDYQLAVMMINKIYYMTNDSMILVENSSLFSPVSQLNYEYYSNVDEIKELAVNSSDVQCVVGEGFVPFGQAQKPSLTDYADKADTLQFLLNL